MQVGKLDNVYHFILPRDTVNSAQIMDYPQFDYMTQLLQREYHASEML